MSLLDGMKPKHKLLIAAGLHLGRQALKRAEARRAELSRDAGVQGKRLGRQAQQVGRQVGQQVSQHAHSAQDQLLAQAAALLQAAGNHAASSLVSSHGALRRAPGALGQGARRAPGTKRERDLGLALGIGMGVSVALIGGLAYATWQEHTRLKKLMNEMAEQELRARAEANSETGIEDDAAYVKH